MKFLGKKMEQSVAVKKNDNCKDNKRYVLVAHKWWVSSRGFEVKEIFVQSEDDADSERLKWEEKLRNSYGDHIAAIAVEIG